MARILVTSATGRVGSSLLPKLVDMGHDVIALTSRPAGMDELAGNGVEPLLGDMRNPDTIAVAAASADAIFLATADDQKQDEIERNFINMVKQNGRPHIVKLSAQSAGLSPPVSFGKQHLTAEYALVESGLTFTILRPTFFLQSLLLFANDVAQKKKIIAPIGVGKVAMVDVDDVASAAAKVLNSKKHFGQTYMLTGPSAHSFEEVVGLLSNHLKQKITHVSPPTFVAKIMLPFLTDMPRWKSNLVVDLLSALKSGAQETVSSDVEQLTGQPGTSLEAFLLANIDAFKTA